MFSFSGDVFDLDFVPFGDGLPASNGKKSDDDDQ